MIFQSGTSPVYFEKLQKFDCSLCPAGWTPPKTKYVHNVCIDIRTKRNKEIGNRAQLFPSVRLSVEFISSDTRDISSAYVYVMSKLDI
jgi:hypothetical protein